MHDCDGYYKKLVFHVYLYNDNHMCKDVQTNLKMTTCETKYESLLTRNWPEASECCWQKSYSV